MCVRAGLRGSSSHVAVLPVFTTPVLLRPLPANHMPMTSKSSMDGVRPGS